MGESDRVNVPDRVEPACRADRLKLLVSIVLACINPAPPISTANRRKLFILFSTFSMDLHLAFPAPGSIPHLQAAFLQPLVKPAYDFSVTFLPLRGSIYPCGASQVFFVFLACCKCFRRSLKSTDA